MTVGMERGQRPGGDLRSSFTLTSIRAGVLKATEDLESGVTLNAIRLAKLGLLCAVDLGKLDVLLNQSSGSLLVLGGEGLAVTTPGSVDWMVLLEIGHFARHGFYLHSARTRSLALTNSSNVAWVNW